MSSGPRRRLRRIAGGLAIVVLAGPLLAQEYLPSSTGNRWFLKDHAGATMDFEIIREPSTGSYRLQWVQPWSTPVYLDFRRDGARHFLTGADFGSGFESIDDGLLYLAFDLPEGTTWKNGAGEFTVLAFRSATVQTPQGVFERCTVIRQTGEDATSSEWAFAPDVGIVRYSSGDSVFAASAPAMVVQPVVLSETPAAVPKGTRVLGLDVNLAGGEQYENAFARARTAGAQTVSLTVNWEDLEPIPGRYVGPGNTLATANAYYAPSGTKLDLFVIAMDPRGRNTPRDLRFLSFDHPVLIERYQRLLDFVLSQLPGIELNFLAVGSEVDLGLGPSASRWAAYTTFIGQIRDYVKLRWPQVRVGASVTLNGMIGQHMDEARALQKMVDVTLVSYYPVTGLFRVRPSNIVRWDIDRVVELYPDHELVFEQTGYPSSEQADGSEQSQADFVREVFRAWDRHSQRIQSVTFTWLTDLSAESVDVFSTYYGVYYDLFRSFLQTLGLRREDGSEKPALAALQEEAASRGWIN